MSDLNSRLLALAATTPRDALLSTRMNLGVIRELVIGKISEDSVTALREAGYVTDDGDVTEAGQWLRAVVAGNEAVSLSLRWQHANETSELQMFIDEDLVLLLETRTAQGMEHPEALIGYASYLDLPFVMASWLNLGPAAVAPVPERTIDAAAVRALAGAAAPAGLGSLSVHDTSLLDFAYDGERYFVLIAPTGVDAAQLTLATLTSSNLLQLLTAAATAGA